MNALMQRTFREAVRDELERRGLTLRSQRIRTGLAHSTLMNWLQGVKPSMEAVIQFARGLGLDEAEWLALAGYEPILPSGGDTDEYLAQEEERLRREYPEFADFTVEGKGGLGGSSRERVDRIVRTLEEQFRRLRERSEGK